MNSSGAPLKSVDYIRHYMHNKSQFTRNSVFSQLPGQSWLCRSPMTAQLEMLMAAHQRVQLWPCLYSFATVRNMITANNTLCSSQNYQNNIPDIRSIQGPSS